MEAVSKYWIHREKPRQVCTRDLMTKEDPHLSIIEKHNRGTTAPQVFQGFGTAIEDDYGTNIDGEKELSLKPKLELAIS
ncbi:hypothetical protein TNCV_660661 [Trichonephila clavipes]|nr:hypothetical protein TNCV_660661 [Trichonephila clavipes]